jgi:hypothetical protein
MLAMDWEGAGSAGRVARSRLVTGTCFSSVALRRVTNLAPTTLSLSSLLTAPHKQYSDVDLFPPADEALLYLL